MKNGDVGHDAAAVTRLTSFPEVMAPKLAMEPTAPTSLCCAPRLIAHR
jgi:hypothetical protein